VAQRLGVAAASLYGHVANKEQLIQLLLDRIFAESEIPDPDADDWEAVCRTWMRDFRRILRRHPGVAGLTMGRVPLGPHSIRRMEALLGVARRSGLPDQVAAYVGDLFGVYVGAIVQEEDMADQAAPGFDVGDFQAAFRDWLRALPEDEYPNLVALAKELSTGSAEERFEWGLEVLLRGVATFIPPDQSRGRARAATATFNAPAAAPSPGPDRS
jgi:AcrR family transcriptional regulator